jgi:hypothetical protein
MGKYSMMYLCFYYGKIKIKHWNIGPTIPFETFLYVFLIQL